MLILKITVSDTTPDCFSSYNSLVALGLNTQNEPKYPRPAHLRQAVYPLLFQEAIQEKLCPAQTFYCCRERERLQTQLGADPKITSV